MLETTTIAAKIPDLLKEIYGDIAKPGVTQVGKALGGLLGLGNTAMLPVHLLNEKARLCLERNFESYREQAEKIPDDKVATIPPEVGVPILEKLSYVSNIELSDMYINLLAKASQQGTANTAHPGFTHIIDRLSPDEGILLGKLKETQAVPFIEIRLTNRKTGEYQTLEGMVFHPQYLAGLTFPQNIDSYFSNLNSLGILTNIRDSWMVPVDRFYNPIWELSESKYKNAAGKMPDKKTRLSKVPFRYHTIRIFVSQCLLHKGELRLS